MEAKRESLLNRLTAGRKPGLMSRLSHLIIVQVVFVFAALVLVIFTPNQYLSVATGTSGGLPNFGPVAAEIAKEAACRTSEDFRDGAGSYEIGRKVGAQPGIRRAVLYRIDDGGLVALDTWGGEDGSLGAGLWDESEFPPLRLSAVDEVASPKSTWPAVPLKLTDEYVVYGAPVHFGDGFDGLFVAAWHHNLFVSDRMTLGYVLLLLFLCAALIALLTVYLIHRHFTQPFRQLVRRFERTSDGELYYLMEHCGEGELRRLAEVFNKFSRTLIADQKQLNRYGEQLRDASSSLEDSQRLLSAVIDNSPVGVITTDAAGRILLLNRKAGEIFGYDEAEALGDQVGKLFVNDVEEQTRGRDGYEDEHGLEMVGKRRDGSQFAAYLITSILRNERQECIGYVYIVRDISQRKDFQAMMVRLDRYYTRGEMASEIAHEINNYLSILMGNIELVPLLLRKGNMERLEQKLELMHGMVEKIARFTDGLLDGSHDEIRFDRCDINQMVENVVAFLKPQNRFDNTEVIMEMSSDIPLVQVDPGLMQQALVNLVYNAGDAVFGSDGERWIRISTYLVEGASVPTLGIKVHDSGPGVAAEKLPLLFKRRFTTKPRGHGIGLIACRKILDSHDGEISYQYEEGALFTMTVPVEHASVGACPAETAVSSSARQV